MDKREYIKKLTQDVINNRKYRDLCLKEREIFEQDRKGYLNRIIYHKGKIDPEILEIVSVSYQNYKLGISPTLCHRVDFIVMDKESKLATMLGCKNDEPFPPFIDKYLEGLDHG